MTAARNGVSAETGGFIDTPNQRFAIAHRSAVDDRARSRAHRRAARARRRRSASATSTTVTEGFPPPIGDAIINNVPGLLLIVEKQLGANTLDVTRGVDAALESLKPALGDVAGRPDDLPAGDVHRDVARQPEPRADLRLRPRRARADRLPRRLADGAHQQRRDSAVAARRRVVPALSGRHVRHDGARRPRHRARRGRRRRDHRRREHRPAAAPESRGRHRRGRRCRSCSRPRSRCGAPCSTAR